MRFSCRFLNEKGSRKGTSRMLVLWSLCITRCSSLPSVISLPPSSCSSVSVDPRQYLADDSWFHHSLHRSDSSVLAQEASEEVRVVGSDRYLPLPDYCRNVVGLHGFSPLAYFLAMCSLETVAVTNSLCGSVSLVCSWSSSLRVFRPSRLSLVGYIDDNCYWLMILHFISFHIDFPSIR